MNMHSIRTKSTLPVMVMGLTIIIVISMFWWMMSLQNNLIEIQSKSFMPASEVILNADRDLYQAKLAQLNILSGQSDAADQQEIDRQENIQQVAARYTDYREYLKDFPEISGDPAVFNQAYQEWVASSDALVQAYNNGLSLNLLKQTEDQEFAELRDILDKSGEAVINGFEVIEKQLAADIRSSMREMETNASNGISHGRFVLHYNLLSGAGLNSTFSTTVVVGEVIAKMRGAAYLIVFTYKGSSILRGILQTVGEAECQFVFGIKEWIRQGGQVIIPHITGASSIAHEAISTVNGCTVVQVHFQAVKQRRCSAKSIDASLLFFQ